MQMRLVFSALSFLASCVEKMTSVYSFGVCRLPRIADANFRAKCSPFAQRSMGFVCDLWTKVTLTDVENFRKIINGSFAYCSCEISGLNEQGGIFCTNRTIGLTDNDSEGTKHDLTLSIVFLSLKESKHKLSSGSTYGGGRRKSTNSIRDFCENQKQLSSSALDFTITADKFRKDFLDFHRKILRARWKSEKCSTDIIIFAFDEGDGRAGSDDNFTNAVETLKRTVQIEASAKAKKLFGDQLTTVVDKINNEQPLSTAVEKIDKLLVELKTLEAALPDGVIEHGIPRWATITFVVCISISILAVVVGNFVNDDSSRKRKSSSMTGKANRKWRAGFSGGMWAV